MEDVTLLEESVIKVEEIKEEVCDEIESVECGIQVNKELCAFALPEDCHNSEEEYLEPLMAVFLKPKEETEDNMLEKDPLAPNEEAGSSATTNEKTFQIPVSRCAEEVPGPSQQHFPALSVETEERGVCESAVGVLPAAGAAKPRALSPVAALCQSNVSCPLGTDSQMLSSSINTQWSCQHCSCAFARVSQLNRHQQTSNCGLNRYKCTECNCPSANISELSEHKISDTGLKQYKCTECFYTTAHKSHLKTHLRIHSGIKPYKCMECDYTAVQSSDLKKHKRIHSGIKPFKCTECDYTAAQTSALKFHQSIHSGIKPYKCTDCDYTAARSSDLKKHQSIHSGIKPYKCTECDYTAAQNCDLKKHQRIHSGIKPFKCTECDFTAAQSSTLKSHKRIHSGR